MKTTSRPARILVWLNAPTYLLFGLVFLLQPERVASMLDIQLTSATALADFRAIYGGLPLGAGLFMLGALKRDAWMPPVIALIALCSLELGLARLYSWLVSGTPSGVIFAFMAVELACFGFAVACFRRLGDRSRPAATDLHTASA